MSKLFKLIEENKKFRENYQFKVAKKELTSGTHKQR